MAQENDGNNNKPNIVIVGAGLSGLALANGISRLGRYNIHVVEKRKTFTAQGAALGLAPNGASALEEMCPGIAEEMEGKGIRFENGPQGSLLLPWWNLRDVLLRRARECDDVSIHVGLELESIEDDPSGSRATVRFKDDPMELEGEIVVGADGVNSAVRSILGHKPAILTNAVACRGHFDASKESSKLRFLLERGPVPLQVFDAGDTNFMCFNFHPKSPRIIWCLNSNKREAQDMVNPLDLFQFLESKVDAETWSILENIRDETDLEHAMITNLKVQDMSQETLNSMGKGWGGKGRITLIGDAAHAMRPMAGQGGNTAFEDCVVLCRILSEDHTAQSLKDSEFCDKQIVTRFEQSRLERVRKIHDDQRISAEKLYRKEKIEPWTPEFAKWVYSGV